MGNNIGMKSIVFLGAFALFIILALGDVPQESSQDLAEASEFGLLEREAREAGRKKRKGNKRNKKGKRNGKKLRGRKRKNKGKGKAKGNGKQGRGRKGNGKGKSSNKKPRNNQRQDTTVPAADVSTVFAEYRKGTNRLRQVKRIVKWISQIQKKETKAATEFGEAAKALDEATNTGADCNGALANNTVKAEVLELNNCSASAKAACAPENYANVSESEAKNCVDILELSVNSTKAWLSDPKTSTYPPVYPDQTC